MNNKIIIFILSSLLFSCNTKEEIVHSDSISEVNDTIRPITQKSFTDVIPSHFTDSAKIEALKHLVNKIDLDTNLVLKEIIDPVGKTYIVRRNDSIVKIDSVGKSYAFFRNDSLVKHLEGSNLHTLQTSLTKDKVSIGGSGGMDSFYFYMGKLIYLSNKCRSSMSTAMCNSGYFSFNSYFYQDKIIDQILETSAGFSSTRCPCGFEYSFSEKIMNSESSEYAIDILKRVDRIKALVNP